MKPGVPVAQARREPSPHLRRIWRVFEYRRPVPVRRPRFTT
jgi:hypothetical protein